MSKQETPDTKDDPATDPNGAGPDALTQGPPQQEPDADQVPDDDQDSDTEDDTDGDTQDDTQDDTDDNTEDDTDGAPDRLEDALVGADDSKASDADSGEKKDDPAEDKPASDDVATGLTAAAARRSRFGRKRARESDLPLPDRHARRRRRLTWHFSIWTVALLALAAVFLVLVSMSATGRVLTMPDWVTQRIERSINTQSGNVQVSLSRVELGITSRGLPRLRLVDLGVRDATGLEIGRLNAVEGALFLGPVLSGNVAPQSLSLSGAQITVRRQRDGAFDLSLGQGIGASGDLAAVLDRIDTVFSKGVLAQTDTITATNLTITLEDARSGRLWQVTDGRLTVSQTEKALDMTLSFDVFNQTEELAETVLGFRSVKGSSAARLTATFKNALARDIAAQSPLLTFLGLVDAPISGALRTVIDASGAVSGLAGTLEFGAGTLSPDPAAKPVKFTGGKVYLDYDPERERMNFADMFVESDWGVIHADGHTYLRGWSAGWPTELLGQLQVSKARISPPGVFEAPIELGEGAADFRLTLDPFRVDMGQFAVSHDGAQVTGAAKISTDSEGWVIAVDAQANHVTPQQVTAFWPLTTGLRSRKWTHENVIGGQFNDVAVAWRKQGSDPAHTALSADFEGVTVQAVKSMAPIEEAAGQFSIDGRRLVVMADRGVVRPRDRNGKVAGMLDAAGTSFVIPQMARRPKDPDAPRPPVPALVNLAVSGPLTSALHLLDDAPFRIFRDTPEGAIGPDMATGRIDLAGRIDIALQPKPPRDAVRYDLTGTLAAVKSDKIVAGKTLSLPQATLEASDTSVSIGGRGSLSGVPMTGKWVQALKDGKAAPVSTVSGQLTLDQAFLDAFSIGLPKGSISGSAQGDYEISLQKGQPPRMTLSSSLDGLGVSIAPLGWSKPKSSKGTLSVVGRLGATPVIDKIALRAPGLETSGSVLMAEGGGLVAAQFDRVRLGGWLDAPVTLTGRGAGKPVSVTVKGGRVDLRKVKLGAGNGTAPVSGGAVPISLILDRLTISEGIWINEFQGDFTRSSAGMKGTFKGRLGGVPNSRGPRINGTAAPQPNGTAYRITSPNAGGVMRAAGVFKSARKGDLELILAPGGGEGVYEGNLKIKNVDVHDAPAMAELLSAISVVGLLQQLGGKGIAFTDVDARFRLDPEKITVYESAATGHSMGISMDGYYQLGSGQMDMQGVISPFYVVNSAGRIFARKGEGLLGFNYDLRGTASDPKVSVNPLSLFTPGFFRDIFRRNPPPQQQDE